MVVELRILATVCVVYLHTCSTLCDNKDIFIMSKAQDIFFNAAYQMMYWTVPVFFMITGILMLNPNKKIKSKDFVCIYSKRMFLALLVFGIPYALLKLVMKDNISVSLLINSVRAVIEDTGFGHLWYLYSLIGIYLALPFLRVFVKNASNEDTKLVLMAFFVMNFIFPIISDITGVHIAFSFPVLYPVFYVLLGYELNKYKEFLVLRRKLLLEILVAVIVIVWIANIFNYKAKYLTTYYSPIIVVLSVAIMGLFISKQYEYKMGVWKIDRLCFGVYLIHPFFIQFTYRFLKLTPLNFRMYPIAVFVFFAIFLVFSFFASWFINLIPFLRKHIL